MDSDSLPHPKRRTPKKRALPPLPARLRRLALRAVAEATGVPPEDLQAGGFTVSRAVVWSTLVEQAGQTRPLRAAVTTTDDVARMIARVEARLERLRTLGNRVSSEYFALTCELPLLGQLHPTIAARWQTDLARHADTAAAHVRDAKQVQARLSALEPVAQAWLRRQLESLAP